jgi:hypothetical protein
MPEIVERDGDFCAALANANRTDKLDAAACPHRDCHCRHVEFLPDRLEHLRHSFIADHSTEGRRRTDFGSIPAIIHHPRHRQQ